MAAGPHRDAHHPFEGEGKFRWFEGNYQAYIAKRREEIGADAEQPHRIKYKKLTHA